MLALLLTELLQDMGHEVVQHVHTIETAKALAGEIDVDVAILDLNLNGRVSFGVADTLRDRGVPFIFGTGYWPTIVHERFPGVPVLAKPYSESELAQALEGVTAR